MPTCLITGADGFVGRALCQHLLAQNYTVHGTVREKTAKSSQQYHLYATGNIDSNTRWDDALNQVDTIVHLAGTVHRPDITDATIYQRSIVEGTQSLTEQAITAGVKRLVYVSSAHVYGVTHTDIPITETHPCHPQTPYAQAKWQAEQLLQTYMQKTALEIVIVRPPLIYGPGVRGNFAQLIKLVKRLPCLPLGCATQPRSLAGLDNLTAFLYLCMMHKKAANTVFNISDNEDISTRALCEKIATLLHKKRVFLPIPKAMMKLCLMACGQVAMYDKLFAAMQLDIRLAQERLNWKPEFGVAEGLRKALL